MNGSTAKYTQLRLTVACIFYICFFFTGDDDRVFMITSLNATPKTTAQHLIVRSGKSEAEVTIMKECARAIVLLKLTTDGHEASRGFSATAELLVLA